MYKIEDVNYFIIMNEDNLNYGWIYFYLFWKISMLNQPSSIV